MAFYATPKIARRHSLPLMEFAGNQFRDCRLLQRVIHEGVLPIRLGVVSEDFVSATLVMRTTPQTDTDSQ